MDFDLYDDLLVGEDAPPSEREQKLIDENEALKVSILNWLRASVCSSTLN